jgi:polar amino acid transport system substrate-binding protein
MVCKLVTRYWALALLSACCGLSNAADDAAAESLREGGAIEICDDVAEFPPYIFHKREGSRKTDTITGMAYDLATTILARHKLKFRVQLIPWKRCEEGTKLGIYVMGLSGSLNPERLSAFYMVGPHSVVRNYYFYSRERHPDGLDIRAAADLRKYSICGIYGYNYEAIWDLPNGFVDKGATDYESLVGKVLVGRCDLFLEGLEIIEGFKLIGSSFLDDSRLGGRPMPTSNRTTSFFFMVSRKHPQGRAVADLFTRELEHMAKSGELKSIRERYIKPVK